MWLKLCLLLFISAVSSQNQVGTGTCEYSDAKSRRFTGYLCKLTANNSEKIAEINGQHLEGRSDDNVQYVSGPNLTITSLTSIFCDTFKNTERMSIFKSPITKINENALQNCQKLQLFDFCDTKITEIPENLFAQSSQMLLIKLNRNRITTLPENIFSTLHDLLKLFIYSNKISYLPPNIFKSNTKMRLIFLNDNKLTAVHAEWFANMPELEHLNLANNQILELPKDAFVNLQNLPLIWLADNNLTVIHGDSFGTIKKLEQLYVERNKINAIDENFINNTGIRKFDMTGNVCSQQDVNNRFELKDAFKVCFDNYQPRKL